MSLPGDSTGEYGSVHGVTDAGVAGKHPVQEISPALVAPATAQEANKIVAGIIPVACWRVDSIRFAFASSFILPSIKPELTCLQELIQEHPECPLSIFGHADPVGDDDNNKVLSGRRAIAIYGLLTRNTDLWERLYSNPTSYDSWGDESLSSMLAEVSSGDTDASSYKQRAAKRQELFSSYMDALCGAGLRLTKEDFLARGADSEGRGDYQGCSEFNPVLIFSAQKQRAFDQADDKTERNQENAPNRRVMVLIFRRHSQVDPAKWPCPSATAGVGRCLKRFWSDGEKRRNSRLPDEDRTFDKNGDTFACRFYQRLTSASPCQRTLYFFRVRLYDPTGKFLPLAPYRLTIGSRTFPPEEADAEGFIVGREVQLPNRCVVEWALPQKYHQYDQSILQDDDSNPGSDQGMSDDAIRPDEPLPQWPPGADNPGNAAATPRREYPFRLELYLQAQQGDKETQAKQMLNNLGYIDKNSLSENVSDFQADYGDCRGLRVTGELDAKTFSAIQDVHRKCEDNLRSKPEPGDSN